MASKLSRAKPKLERSLMQRLLAKSPFDCTNGANSLAALRQAGIANLRGKILVQVSNPLDFSKGMPPTLTICNTDSLGEQIKANFPMYAS
jgi:hypothetical protein